MAVCRFLDVPLTTALAPGSRPRLLVICADVRDPGNAGTVIRTADAAGADGVVLAGSSVDAYNPKTVRASVGSLFHLPVAVEPDITAAVAAARAAGLTVLAADGAGEVVLDDAEPTVAAGPTAWLFGNEAWGLPPETAALADHRVRIPIHGRAESLNLSTAAALCLYASAAAQRGAEPRSSVGCGPWPGTRATPWTPSPTASSSSIETDRSAWSTGRPSALFGVDRSACLGRSFAETFSLTEPRRQHLAGVQRARSRGRTPAPASPSSRGSCPTAPRP